MRKIVIPKGIGYLGSDKVVNRSYHECLQDAVSNYNLDLYFEHIMNPHSAPDFVLASNTLGVFCGGARLPGIGEVVERIDVAFPYDWVVEETEDLGNMFSAFDYGPFTFCPDAAKIIEFYADIVDEEFRRWISMNAGKNFFNKATLIGRYYVDLNILIVSDLTHGMVTIGVLGKIVDELRVRGYMVAKYGNKEPVEKKRSTITVTVGCDPEFEYLGANGSIMSHIPNSFVTFDLDGCVEETGIDGSGVVAEIRPSPAVGPKELVDNIYDLFKRVKGHRLSVIGNRHAIGCHLHFGVGCSWNAHRDLVDMLDDFVGEPCFVLNGNARGEYGILGGVREQPHGFEYRPLPAGITADPEFFRIVVKICKVVVQKYVNGKTMEYDVTRHKIGDIAYFDGQKTSRVASAPTRESYRNVCGLNDDEISYFWRYLDGYREIPTERLKNVIACWVDNSHGNVGVGWSEGGELDVRAEVDSAWLPDEDSDTQGSSESSRPPQVDFHVELAPNVECCVHLCEDWSREVRRDVTEDFGANVIRELVSRGITDFGSITGTFISLSLIGLRNNRGLVVHGFDPPVLNVEPTVQHTRVTCLDNTSGGTYGLSRWFRNSHDGDSGVEFNCYLEIKRALVTEMCRHVVDRIRASLTGASARTTNEVMGDQPHAIRIGSRASSVGGYWIDETRLIRDDIGEATQSVMDPSEIMGNVRGQWENNWSGDHVLLDIERVTSGPPTIQSRRQGLRSIREESIAPPRFTYRELRADFDDVQDTPYAQEPPSETEEEQ